jgi:2-oxoisovalerate dehydrogenase E1 component alpha subunit
MNSNVTPPLGSQPLDFATDELVAVYRGMVRARMVDEAVSELQASGRIGFHVGSIGEEAAIVASAAALRPQDWIFPSYREFGAALHRGMTVGTYFHHMFGNASDPTKGRQMPDHPSARSAHFASVSSPVGTQISHAVGFAWAARSRKEDLVTLVYFGEGATSSGEFHNGINFAGVLKAPVVLFCRHSDAHAPEDAADTVSALPNGVASRGIAYGVPALRCDGNDPVAVYQATRAAIARATSGGGPTLIEAMTERRREDEDWATHDPIQRLRKLLESQKLWTLFREASLESEVRAEIAAAIAAAEAVPPPSRSTLFEDVFASPPWNLREQAESDS